jgi:hypothetical protein
MRKGFFHFLDLPIYRLPEDEYYKKRSLYIESMVKKWCYQDTPSSPLIAKRLAQNEQDFREHCAYKYGGNWKYNEVIGYLRLYLLGSQVRAEYWRVNAKRIVRTRKKQFEYWDWKLAPETELPTKGSNNEIYLAILEHVEDCRKGLKKRYLDTEQLTTIGPYVDWRALFEWK